MTMKQPVDVTSVEWKTKNTYDSCMSLDPIETEGKLPLVKRISQLGNLVFFLFHAIFSILILP